MAKVLLKQAGYDASHPLRFELFYNKYDLHEKTAIALSSEWKKMAGCTGDAAHNGVENLS